MSDKNSHIGSNKEILDNASSKLSYRVLARKYRPSSLEELIGQEAMVKTLENAFESGRIHQAYMLTGVRGVGKTSTARILARALNYEPLDDLVDGEKSDTGPTFKITKLGRHCEAIMSSSHVDVIEMDAASHTGIDDVREIIDAVQYKPVSARYKVYIIDEVHMLSRQAFNGLLKTLEEPPEHVKFIFATTEIRKVPITILSRCQRFDLRRVTVDELVKHYKSIINLEGVEAEDEAVLLITQAADGSVRDGLSILDQAIAFSDGIIKTAEVSSMLGQAEHGLIIDLFEALITGDVNNALLLLNKMYSFGADIIMIFNELSNFTHFVTKLKLMEAQEISGLISAVSNEVEKRAKLLTNELDIRKLGRLWQMLLKASEEIKLASNSLAAAEMAIIRITHMANLPLPDEIIRSYNNLANTKGSQNQSNSDSKKKIKNNTKPLDDLSSNNQLIQNDNYVPNNTDAENISLNADNVGATKKQENNPQLNKQSYYQFESFDDVINGCIQDREIELKRWLKKYVRLVSFKKSEIEISLEAGSEHNKVSKFRNWLNNKTEDNWKVIISDKKGAATIEQQQKELIQKRYESIENEKEVMEFKEIFPEAELIKINENKK